MMKDQMDKELASLATKKEKKQDLEDLINNSLEQITNAEKDKTLFEDGENFLREKEKQYQQLMLLREGSTPSPKFTFYRFKDTLKIDDFGGIQEATYRLPAPYDDDDLAHKKLYIFGDDSFNKTILKYDILKDEWEMEKLQDGPEKFYNCSASIALDEDRLMITGGGSPPQANARIYSISKKELYKDSKMMTPRNAHAITKCQGRIYVLGGFSGKERLNTVERYNEATSQWEIMASMKHRRHYLAACTLND